jgi:hypothetical protein
MCIWEQPTRLAISDWVRPSANRIASTRRARSDSPPSTGRSISTSSTCVYALSGLPNMAAMVVSSVARTGASSDSGRAASSAQRLADLLR